MAAIFAISSPVQAEWIGDARPIMGTEVSVLLWHEDAAKGEDLLEQVFAEVERIDALMSTYIEDSRISEINRSAATEAVVAGDELFKIIRRSLDISVLTLGAFDITYRLSQYRTGSIGRDHSVSRGWRSHQSWRHRQGIRGRTRRQYSAPE
jgi:thiamine biosynthesis lipoprotein